MEEDAKALLMPCDAELAIDIVGPLLFEVIYH